ncbi:MAG TPA: hypothetical protein VN932_03555 [Rhizomicrobium sp.]|nr:hypothetical protein [Rhizomicrobium sp.]
MSAIPDMAFSAALGLAALLAVIVAARARPAARDYLRFAAALYAALALADFIAAGGAATTVKLANAVALIVAAPATCALALALAASFAGAPRARFAAPLLALCALAGIVAAATGMIFIAFAPLFAGVCAMLALCTRYWRRQGSINAIVAALALLAGAAAFMAANRTAFALFCAAGLMGVSLASVRPSRRAVEREPATLDAVGHGN